MTSHAHALGSPSPVTNCHTFSDPHPLERHVLYGRPPCTRRGTKRVTMQFSWIRQRVGLSYLNFVHHGITNIIATLTTPEVHNPLRLKGQILFLGGGPPVKIVPMESCQNCLYADHQRDGRGQLEGRGPQVKNRWSAKGLTHQKKRMSTLCLEKNRWAQTLRQNLASVRGHEK